ncbi:MAG: 30S ribosome-binding factor RbfA [Kiritimatiellia bacterium]
MPVDRLERVNSLLKRVLGEAMFRVLQGDDVNPGVITITGVACAKNLRNATVRVSVFGEAAEQNRVLAHVVRRTHEFERIVNREVRMKFTPQLRFVLDHSLEKGDRVLSLLDRLSIPADADTVDSHGET